MEYSDLGCEKKLEMFCTVYCQLGLLCASPVSVVSWEFHISNVCIYGSVWQASCFSRKWLFGLSKERPILGDHAKAHIHEIRWISRNPLANLINQIIQEKLFSFMQCSGKAMSQDFMKSAEFHVKSAGF